MIDLDAAFGPLEDDEVRRIDHHRGEDAWRPIIPVPPDAPTLSKAIVNKHAPTGYIFSRGWRYLDAHSGLLGAVIRFDRPANGLGPDKKVLPLSFCHGLGGRREWRSKAFAAPRPLYGLDRLAARPDVAVLVVEGEKASDAAVVRFPDHAVVTSPGGANSARKADWTPLAGRDVVIWPDADAPGARYAADVSEMLRSVGAASVRTVTRAARATGVVGPSRRPPIEAD